jgi:putative glutamine amidotransferase
LKTHETTTAGDAGGSTGSASVVSHGSRPVIGLTGYAEPARFTVWDTQAIVLHRVYVDCVLRAGGIPVVLPPVGDVGTELVERLDGIILTGGADVEASRYGAHPHETTFTRPERDTFEFALLDRAIAAGTPVLAICRGLQLLNVARGGTLTQHLPDTLGGTGHQPNPGCFGTTTITLAPETALGALLGTEVNGRCHHHQAIDRLGSGLVAAGWAADGTVEAIELASAPFALGVQWHPEQDSDDLRLFNALVDAADRKGTV